MKSLHFLFALFIAHTSYSQNESYCIIYNEIYPLLEENKYQEAKDLWLEVEKEHQIDPHILLDFVHKGLKNGDIKFYKKRITSLIKNHGFHFFATDTLIQNLKGHNALIHEKNLHEWLIQKTEKLYPQWIKQNLNSYLIAQKIEQLSHDDQLFRSSIHFEHVTDTNCTGRELSWDILSRADYQNAAELATLSIRNGGLPNDFDHGVGTNGNIGLILWHNFKSEENLNNTWMILSRHIDKAYFEGKISSGYYASYDYWLLYFTGFQFYGFEGDAPVKDQKAFEKRKEKYKFCY